jgi:lambda family phage portal protein
MNWFQRTIAKVAGLKPTARAYDGGQSTRLTLDWILGSNSADAELRGDIKNMRNRTRDLARNDPYVVRYLKLLENNVLGARGIGLQMKVTEPKTASGGKPYIGYDDVANSIIETAWYDWGRRQNCTPSGHLTWIDVCRLVLRSTARDGAILVRKHLTRPGAFNFAVEPIEIDQLDSDYNQSLANGQEVRLGVEYDPTGQVTAYHMFERHPHEMFGTGYNNHQRVRVPAQDILHVYRPDRVGQSTGAPWISSAMTRIMHLNRYAEAEVVAARAGASKTIFFERSGEGYRGEEASTGGTYMEISPGMAEELPPGLKPHFVDPTHPNTAYGPFTKEMLRGIASGWGVSYNSLSNDLEGVNYSSIRAGLLEEREEWRAVQRWFIDWFIQPVFEEWLRWSLGAAIPLPLSKFDKFNQPEWKPRAWPWVDPLKDMEAQVLAVEKGFKSRRAFIAEAGDDIEEVFAEQEQDALLAEEHGLTFTEPVDNPAKVKGNDDGQSSEQ